MRPTLWTDERKATTDLFEGHKDHPGLVAVLQWVARWLQEGEALAGSSDRPPKGARELDRLSRYGVSALQVVTEAVAHSYWVHKNPGYLPDTKAQWFALARAVMALAPRPRVPYLNGPVHKDYSKTRGYATRVKPPAVGDVEALGRKLMETLAPFMVTCRAALELRQEQKENVLQAMRQPFNPPVAVLVAEATQVPAPYDQETTVLVEGMRTTLPIAEALGYVTRRSAS